MVPVWSVNTQPLTAVPSAFVSALFGDVVVCAECEGLSWVRVSLGFAADDQDYFADFVVLCAHCGAVCDVPEAPRGE